MTNKKLTSGLIILSLLLILTNCSEPKVNYNIAPGSIRIASFNASMFRPNSGELLNELKTSETEQISNVAEIIQRLRPDIVVINEFDYDSSEEALNLFSKNYLEKNQSGVSTIHYPFRKAFASNTGIPSGVDLNGDGKTGEPNDAYGYGTHPGQYAFVIYSRYPIVNHEIRSFQNFLWKDMPDAVLPVNEDGSSYLPEESIEVFRLSSKNHVDVPIEVNGRIIHALISHPTPPVFDGPEDLNGKRNHDEIRLWKDYLNNESYLVDDNGKSGGLANDASFVILGDLNADPVDGDSYNNAVKQLLDHPRVHQDVSNGSMIPVSAGSLEAYTTSGKNNRVGNPDYHTSVYGLRIDYVLPSADLKITGSGVFWPHSTEDSYHLSNGNKPSDHRFVWVDFHAVF